MRSIPASIPVRATNQASDWSSPEFSRSSSPVSNAEELHERINETVVDEDNFDRLERGRVVEEEEQGDVENFRYVDNEEDLEEEEEGEEFTVMGRHGALISLIWGATALYVLLIRAKV